MNDDEKLNTSGSAGSGTSFYFDYQNGSYGFNTSASRGADTFNPFKSGENFGFSKWAIGGVGTGNDFSMLLYSNGSGTGMVRCTCENGVMENKSDLINIAYSAPNVIITIREKCNVLYGGGPNGLQYIGVKNAGDTFVANINTWQGHIIFAYQMDDINNAQTIYNAIVAQGITPASSSVSDIVSCISNGDLDKKVSVAIDANENDQWGGNSAYLIVNGVRVHYIGHSGVENPYGRLAGYGPVEY